MKTSKFNTNLSLLFHFLKGSKKYFIFSIFFIFLINILNLFVPKMIAFTIDSLINTNEPNLNPLTSFFIEQVGGLSFLRENIGIMALILCLFALFAAIFQYLNLYLNAKGSELFIKRMREEIFSHLNQLPFSFQSENKTGDIIQRCTSDVEQVKNFVSKQIAEFLRTMVLIIVSLYFMITISFKLTLVALILIPLNGLYSFIRQKKISEGWRKNEEEVGLLSAIAQENIAGVRVVRAFGKEDYETKKFRTQLIVIYNLWKGLNFLFATYWSIMQLIINIQILIVTVFGITLTLNGELLAGELIAFISYNLMLSWPVLGLSHILTNFIKVRVAFQRIAYIMEASEEKDDGKRLTPSMREEIVFENVGFSYNEKTKIFEDLSFKVKSGETVGILGGTGSGKSTLMYLLTKLYPLSSGKIMVGGVDIKDIKTSYLRKNIGLILQEPYLFSGTIRENILTGCPSATDRAINEAVETSSLAETIADFKNGLETFVGEKGVTLSGGQKQRVAIARTIIGKAPIMLFDDSLSAVDTETDANIRRALSKNSEQSTRFIISHRITTLMNADKIVVLDKGRVAEMGSHEELLAKNGIYQHLYNIQFMAR